MRRIVRQAGTALKGGFETLWNYLGSLAAVSLFAAVLGLGIFHAVVQDAEPRTCCFAGVRNKSGAVPPEGLVPLGRGRLRVCRMCAWNTGRMACCSACAM